MRTFVGGWASSLVLIAVLTLASDAGAAGVTVYAGEGNVFYEGPTSTVLCCPYQSFSCDGVLIGSETCECNNPPYCWPDTTHACQGDIFGVDSCVPNGDQCPPPDDATMDQSISGGACVPPKTPFGGDEPDSCPDTKQSCDRFGADPIMASARTAATTPFTDFRADRLSPLSLTRTYSSADTDADTSGSGGIFGRSWRHDWDSYLTCQGGACTIKRGVLNAFSFSTQGSYLSPDGSETWEVFGPYARTGEPTHHHLLARRPTGEWLAFLSDGRTLHYAQVCTSCDAPGSASCTPAASGGRARLVGIADPAGNLTSVSYDPANRVLLRLADGLGHALEVRGSQACAGTASELRYDGALVASYTMQGNQLRTVKDADGKVLRAYVYTSAGLPAPRLQAVMDESGTALAEFNYDSQGRVIGLVDAESSLGVEYRTDCRAIFNGVGWWAAGVCNSVTMARSYYRGRFGDEISTSSRVVETVTGFLGFGGRFQYGLASDGDRTRTLQWAPDGRPLWSADGEGHNIQRAFDEHGRETYRVEFRTDRPVGWVPMGGAGSVLRQPEPPPNPLPADSREAWREYGVSRTVAGDASVALDLVTRHRSRSVLQPGGFVDEDLDYHQSPTALDPAGYSCTQGALPAGSVLCRRLQSGYVTVNGVPALERHATFYSYDTRGRLIRTYGPINLDRPGPHDVVPVEERSYFGDGDTPERQARLRELKRYASPAEAPMITGFDYDRFGVSKVTAPDGTSVTLTKDGRGRSTFTSYLDASGVVRATAETRYADGETPRLRILPGGGAERYTYDQKGRLKSLEQLSGDPEAPGANPTAGWSEHYIYDQSGNRIHAERRSPTGAVTWQQDRGFDDQHRVVWESNPSQPALGKGWTFSPSGFLKGMEDEEGRAVTFLPDGLSRVVSVLRSGRDAVGQPASATVASYGLVPGGDALASVTDGTGRPVNYRYDDFGRVELVSGPTLSSGGGARYQYDARGNVVARGDATVNVTYQYDGLDRLRLMQANNSADGSSVSYTYGYDSAPFTGRLTSISGPEGTTSFAYDWAGRLKTEVMAVAGVNQPFTTAYDYDANGRLWKLTYPSGLVVEYLRDAASGEVTGVQEAGGGRVVASGVRYAGKSAWAALTFGNGQLLAHEYTLRNEPLSVRSGPVSLDYLPSPSGNVGVVTDKSVEPSGCVRSAARTFTYDFHDRLVAWSDTIQQGPGVCGPDSLGSGPAGFTYVAGTDLVASQLGANGLKAYAYGYDGQGNVSAIGRYDAAGAGLVERVCLRHDALGRLVLVGSTGSAFAPGGTACLSDAEVSGALGRFKYDARNRRVASQRGGVWTWTVFDLGGNPLSEFQQTENPAVPWAKVRDYLWLDGRLLGQVEYEGVGGVGAVYAAHLDHLGQPRALTSSTGQVVWASYQRPYGEVLEKTAPDAQTGRTVVTNLRLPGQYDERLFAQAGLSGLQGPYYNWNRWYLPGVGRYLELDPIAASGGFNGPWGPNWYGYAEGNPLRWTDPDGLEPFVPQPPGLPPVPVPGGGPGNGWQFNPNPGNGRGGSYGPRIAIPGQSQPSISWEPYGRGHWDMDDGLGGRQRFDRWGNPLTPEQAHRPRPWPGWLKAPTEFMLILFFDPCSFDPGMCRRIRDPGRLVCEEGA